MVTGERQRVPGRSLPGGALAGVVAAVLGVSVAMAVAATDTIHRSAEDDAALHLGRRVLAVQAAIRNPDMPEAMQAITALGLETEHYVMVRGWLIQQLQADRSLCEAWRDNPCPPAVRARIGFLNRAIRAIDLE